MPDSSISTSAQTLLAQAASLLIYQSVLADEAGQAFIALLETFVQTQSESDKLDGLRAYGRWFRALAEQNQDWQDYVLTRILEDDNPFTRQAQIPTPAQLPAALTAAARHDLQVLQTLSQCDSAQLSQWVNAIAPLPRSPVVWSQPGRQPTLAQITTILSQTSDWGDGVSALATLYRQQGVGLFARYRAFRWQAGQLVGIAYPDSIRVTDLVGYDPQKQALLKNTEFLLQGYSALHVLLYGSRGSGKSSLVKGLLQAYADRPLRLIEVAKSDLRDLPLIVDSLRQHPQKFILFVDDLSFEEDDDAYKALKVVLEGNLTARPQNVVVYATSNRRHLIREFFGDRPRPKDGDEVHAWDTVQEKLSFSDRFGLTLTFEPANQPTYLQMVHHLAQQAGIPLSAEELEYRALQWATRHNGRSGRTARQFVDFCKAELAVDTPKIIG